MLCRCVVLSLAITSFACSSDGPPGDDPDPDADTPASDADPRGIDGSNPDPDASNPQVSDCDGVAAYCSSWNVRATCSMVDDTATWTEQTCPAGCYAGACSDVACADECVLGDGCELWDMNAADFVAADDVSSLHDRARNYDRYLRESMLPSGGVANAVYTDTTFTTVEFYNGLIDSAIWTGTELAAQAWRARTTGSADAIAQIRAHTETLHSWFEQTGDPGYLARFVAPPGASDPLDVDCSEARIHCGPGATWLGGVSRDQYTGVMLGYFLAYDATPEETVRSTIRGDVLTIVRELMKQRTAVPVKMIINGSPFDLTIDMEHVILGSADMDDGRVVINVDTGNLADGALLGAREFTHDMGPMLRQIPLLSWVPAVPRPGSAVMLGAFFRMAMHMSDDDEIRSYYEANVDTWLDVADDWSYTGECGKSYYAVNIVYVMAHVWALLEDDPARTARIRDDILDQRLWGYASGHKNPYFAFLWGGTRTAPDASVIDAAVAQLAQFEPGPRVHIGRDNLDAYPHHATCMQTGFPMAVESVSVDVGERVLSDFLWQRHPWALQAFGNPRQTFPGVDFQSAYWAGRHHGFIEEDRPGVCARSK